MPPCWRLLTVSPQSSIRQVVLCRYERRYIERWLAHGCTRCPCSGQTLEPPVLLMPNVALRKCIEEWADNNATWLLVRSHTLLSAHDMNINCLHACCCAEATRCTQIRSAFSDGYAASEMISLDTQAPSTACTSSSRIRPLAQLDTLFGFSLMLVPIDLGLSCIGWQQGNLRRPYAWCCSAEVLSHV